MVETRQQRRYRERQSGKPPAVKPVDRECLPEIRSADYSNSNADPALKGQFDGNCNRTACQASIQGRNYWNSSTRAYYCGTCARDINYWSNRDEGIIICTAVSTADDQPPFPYERMRSRAVTG